MADLLTHVLAGFIIASIGSWRYDWITVPFVAVTMVGAILPDLNRIGLIVPAATIETALAIPFSWTPLHRAGGTLVVIALGTLLVHKQYRKVVFAMLLVGATSHYLLDFVLYKPAGVSGPLLWPFFTDGLAIEGFYRSSNRWPAVVATATAFGIWWVDRTWLGGLRAETEPEFES